MTPKQLEKCGKAMYPEWNWKTELAKSLKVSRMTVLRWSTGAFPIPDARASDILSVMLSRHQALTHTIALIEKSINGKRKKTQG